MATNQDFNDLIDRIETATETLESDVALVGDATEDIAQAVEDAENAAIAANQSYVDAQLLVTQLENAVIIEEAPEDGQQYARKDGEWTVVVGGDGGSVDWDDVDNKPTFATVATTGDYSDLSNTPSLATVATTGDYNDLSNTPSIPSFGTVASRDVVTGNTDTTTTSIPTVAWINYKGYGDVRLGSDAPVQGGLAVWQLQGTKLLKQYTGSSGDEYIRVNSTGVVSSRTPVQVKSDLSLGTAADEDVVEDNSDSTASRIPTVGWVQANISAGAPGVVAGGNAAQYAAQTFIYDVATMENRAANSSDTVFGDAVDVLNNLGRRFPVCITNNNDATNGPTPWYSDGINPHTIAWGVMEIQPMFSNSGMGTLNSLYVYVTIHSRGTGPAYGKRYIRRMRTSGAWQDANWKLIPAVVD